ncbi:DUF2497 domain-containing protein [Rhizobium sp. G187]|uniref:PopZ family protein n=1 Tax=Rhizobium sp. G187 TaxID=3451352 RepID=UPI003EE748AC
MAQPSVVREPSMEEILASIRRIIESNDPATAGEVVDELDGYSAEAMAADERAQETSFDAPVFAPANDLRPNLASERPVTSDRPATSERSAALERMIEPARMEPVRVEPARTEPVRQALTPAAPVEAPKSVSLADLAARVRLAAERTERPVQQASVMASQRGERPMPSQAPRLSEIRDAERRPGEELRAQMNAAPAMEPPQVSETIAPSMPILEPRADVPPTRIASVEVKIEKGERLSFENTASSMASRSEPAFEPVAAWNQPAEEKIESKVDGNSDLAALVSVATVQQVSRSFSDLAAAIDGQQRRSLDEMAEDMLRPMLKEWLDDNLPTLVERLVREEIERVARGPRR